MEVYHLRIMRLRDNKACKFISSTNVLIYVLNLDFFTPPMHVCPI